ncbi:MAG TPA: hypothetical protein VLK33_10320, partial [Terriglobales bacterium]|nr:hypothetical protein [Terriglobales bacterium]
LRYDIALPIKEQHDLLTNFDPAVGIVQVGRDISQPYDTDKNNFSPRLSVAWDMFGTGKTVLRTGGGLIYEIPHISAFIGQNNTNALGIGLNPSGLPGAPVGPKGGTINATTFFPDPDDVSANWKAGLPAFGNLDPTQVSCSADSPCPVFGIAKNLATPYTLNWNLNIQQETWRNAALTVAYVGNKGNKLYSIFDTNQNIYANDEGVLDGGSPDEQTGRPFFNKFPTLSNIYQLANHDNSIYHGLQVTLRQNTTKGLYFVAGYTWSHAIDDASSNRQFNIQNSYNPAAERSNADSDIRNRFTLAMTYDLPSKKGFAQMLQGWTVNSIFTAQGGSPLFFYDSFNDISGTSEFNDHWNISGDPRNIHWSKDPNKPIPFYDVPAFTTVAEDPSDPDSLLHVTGGTDPVSQACYNQAFTLGGQPGADQLIGGPDESIFGGCFAEGGTIITPPAPGQFGNMKRNVIYGPGYVDLDFSIIKHFKLGERFALELRGEFFNILNHPNFADPDHDLSDGSAGTVGVAQFTPDIFESNPVIGSGGSRHIQVGAKIIW